MKRDDYTRANRDAWNEAAPIHARQKLDELLQSFAQPGFSCLDPIETAMLNRIGLAGKAVAQVCCNNGRELLSVKNLGAVRCVGFDISEPFIDQARRLAAAGGIACEFVVADAHAIPASHDAQFDLVIITVGAFGWMADLQAFTSRLTALLKPTGQLFVYETHPILGMFEPGDREPLALRHSCFRSEPFVDTQGLDYWSHTPYASKPMYWLNHRLSAIFGAPLGTGLAIESFSEFDHDVSGVFEDLEAQAIRPPMSYMLVARKMG